MAYDTQVADRIRNYLQQFPELLIEEKKMFSGLAFMINDKMCVNVSGNNLMCRFDPDRIEELAAQPGFLPMIMKGREYKGYCYVEPYGFEREADFLFWMELCIQFNARAKSSKKKK